MSKAIPIGWERASIKSFLDRVIDNRGKTPPISDIGYELLEIASISETKKYPDYSKVRKYVDKETHESWFRAGHPIKDDILIPTVGTIGVCCILKESRGSIAQNLIALRIKPENNPSYTYYILSSYETVKQIEMVVMNAVQPSLKVPEFLGLDVLRPPLPEQQKIAAILTSVDDVIESTQAQINKLKDLKTGMTQELLTKGIGHSEFKDSPVGRIPKAWEVMPLKEIILTLEGGVSVNSENRQKSSLEYGILKTSAVSKGRFFPDENKVILDYEIERAKTNPLSDRIIFSRMNTPELVGESGYIKETRLDLFLPDRLWLLDVKDKNKTDVLWLSYILSSGNTRKVINESATGTSDSMKNISKQNLFIINIVIPSIEEQKMIAKSLLSVDNRIEVIEQKLHRLTNTKKALMQDLLTGKVRVKVS